MGSILFFSDDFWRIPCSCFVCVCLFDPQEKVDTPALTHLIKKWILKNQAKGLTLKALPPRPVLGLTSQVSQRPQQASVVIRRPLQPGFLARKVNSLTAQPTNVCRFPPEVLRTQPQPARRRRAAGPRKRYASLILFPERERKESLLTDPAASMGLPSMCWSLSKGHRS